MAEFVRPGMLDCNGAVFEHLAALAIGIAAGKVYNIMAVWCSHRNRMVLQQLHDNSDAQPTTNPNDRRPDHDRP